MGYQKDLIERLGGGNPGAYAEDYVCADCFENPGIKEFIESEAQAKVCTFCGEESEQPTAASFTDVLQHIKDSLDREYDVAENKLPHDEGEYVGDTWTTSELLDEHLGELPNDKAGTLLDALCDGLGERNWCRRHPFSLTEDERLNFSWDEFCNLVKHHRRYFFLHEKPDDSELRSPLALLKQLSVYCEDFGLVKTIKAGASPLFRARSQKSGETLTTPAQLGPPSQDKATLANRMSPAGVVMLYVGDDPETALRETAKAPATFAIGEFETLRDLTILDLGGVPTIPSIFESISDSAEYDPRPRAIFLNYFATELSKPIEKDDRAHIEYVPTQVITEYFRTEFRYQGRKIDGIRYRSARHVDHYSFVLFATQDDLVEGQQSANVTDYSRSSDPWIKLVNAKQHQVTADDLERWNREVPRQVEWVW